MATSYLLDLLFPTLVVLVVPLYLILKYVRSSNNPSLPTDWPIVGMLPAFIVNRHHINDYLAAVLHASGHNFRLLGPRATSMRFFVTSDPANVRHIFTTNFPNYPKGEELADVFGVLSGTIIAADGESWSRQRARIHHILTRPQLLDLVVGCCRDKVAEGLVPLLTHMANTQAVFDMEGLLGRLVFDTTAMAVFGRESDPGYLSAAMPPMTVPAALDILMEVALRRHTLPVACWKLMRKLNVGQERKMAAAEEVLRRYVAERIQRRVDGLDGPHEPRADMLSHYIHDPDFLDEDGKPTEFLNRTFINKLVMFRDPVSAALPWLIYNLATNPHAVSAIREELAPIAARKSEAAGDGAAVVFEAEDTRNLVYQRAAFFESLRLCPVGPLERKEVLADDVLRGGETVMISVYGMGRLDGVWGQDCRDYRPERWLSDDGVGLRHVPSYEFMPFNTGPRSCLGKKIAVALVTSVVATVIWNFDVELVESRAVEPKLSIVMQMKNGLMVKVNKRDAAY